METKENSVQLGNDWTDSSYIVIDGVVFAPVGFDGKSGYECSDLEYGLQDRIHAACRRASAALNLEDDSKPAFKPRKMRAVKVVKGLVDVGDEFIEIAPDLFRNTLHPRGNTGLDFKYLASRGFDMSEYFEGVVEHGTT